MGDIVAVRRYYADALQDISNILEKAGAGAPAVRDDAIKDAIDRYSEHIPQAKISLVIPITSGFYSLPADFEIGFSRIVSIEFPIDQLPPRYVAERAYAIRQTETGYGFYISTQPGTNFRFKYTARHTSASLTWISAHDESIGQWAAAIAAGWFMDRYGHSVESNNDGVNWRSKAQEFRDNAKALMEKVLGNIRNVEIGIWGDTGAGRITGLRKY
jgi:hypothetical protein